jgi:hypothetical protein
LQRISFAGRRLSIPEESKMARRIAAIFMTLAVSLPVLAALATVQACGTKRSEIRQEERTEQRTKDRYDRRRGDDDDDQQQQHRN